MAKGKIIQQGHKLEREQPVGSEVTQDERLIELIRHIGWKRNVIFKFDTESDDTISRAIALLESRDMRVWHRETGSITLDEVGPQVLTEDGAPTIYDHHVWDDTDCVILRRCEEIFQKPEISNHLNITVANLTMWKRCPVVVMTYRGGLPILRYDTCTEFADFEQRVSGTPI